MARTAAAAGLLSSWVSPADSEPRASSRSRCSTAFWVDCVPKNRPSRRCRAIGNHSRINQVNLSASRTKKRDGSVIRMELV